MEKKFDEGMYKDELLHQLLMPSKDQRAIYTAIHDWEEELNIERIQKFN